MWSHDYPDHMTSKYTAFPFWPFVPFYCCQEQTLNPQIRHPTPSRGGSRIPCRRGCWPSRGAPTYNFVKFPKKLHEIEKILGCRGVHAGSSPLGSTTAQSRYPPGQTPSTSPLGVGLEIPLTRSPSTSLLGVGLETCKAWWDTTPPWKPAARHAGIPPVMHAGIAPPLPLWTEW